jgi:hypothetical protein
MNNQIQRIAPNDAMLLAEQFFRSGLFQDIKSAAQAMVKIMAGNELGLPPLASISGIHIIAGKPVIGAGLIASAVKSSGKYNYRVVENTEKHCSIDFYEGAEKIGNSSFSYEDAKKAGTKNLDKFPKNMLFARAISNGVKWFTPDVFAGPVYVPEEMQQVTEDIGHLEVKQEPPGKPEMTEEVYNKALKAIEAGEQDIIKRVLIRYTVSPHLLSQLQDAEANFQELAR